MLVDHTYRSAKPAALARCMIAFAKIDPDGTMSSKKREGDSANVDSESTLSG